MSERGLIKSKCVFRNIQDRSSVYEQAWLRVYAGIGGLDQESHAHCIAVALSWSHASFRSGVCHCISQPHSTSQIHSPSQTWLSSGLPAAPHATSARSSVSPASGAAEDWITLAAVPNTVTVSSNTRHQSWNLCLNSIRNNGGLFD